METHTDGIWISLQREKATVRELTDYIVACGYSAVIQNNDNCGYSAFVQNNNNYGYPSTFIKGKTKLSCRLVDLVEDADLIVTDNHYLIPKNGRVISVLPEFWSQWRFEPEYNYEPVTYGYNCFMARERGDRDRVFEQLKQRNILDKGLVSYLARDYDTVNTHGTLEQCIIDSAISLVLETYVRDDTIVFSEKIFRVLQLPRPWLLYCSPYSIALLKTHGFDVLEDYVDISYDSIENHWDRMDSILDQLETFMNKTYTPRDCQRFEQAATHNQQLLDQFTKDWPLVLEELKLDIKHPELDWTV